MAAKNYDSKRIFDQYVNRLLKEQEGETEEETVKLPGMPAIPKSGMTAKVPNPFDALMNGETNTYNINAQQALAARKTQAAQQAQNTQGGTTPTPYQGQSSLSLNSTPDLNLQTVRPGQAVAAGTAASTGLGTVLQPGQGGSTPSQQTQVASVTKEPTSEEKALFKKLHGSDYTPGVGDQKLGQLRTAVQQVGNSTDVDKIASAAYSQQYSGTPQGQAYAQRAERQGVRVPKPGEVNQPNTNYAQQFVSPETQKLLSQKQQADQQKQQGQQYAQQAADLGLSPETQKDLAQQSGSSANNTTSTPETKAGLQPDTAAFIDQLKNLPPELKNQIKQALG